MEGLIKTTLEIGGRVYPVKVQQDELQAIESVVSELNQTITHFKNKYPSKDLQDCIAMTLLSHAVDSQLDLPEQTEILSNLSEAHQKIDQILAD